MQIFKIACASSLVLIASLSACSGPATAPNVLPDALIGGAGGAGIGAGTGAIIGSVAGGDVGTAALIGAGSGAVIGLIGGASYAAYEADRELTEKDEEISRNQLIILAREREISRLEQVVDDESRDIKIDRRQFEHQYLGPSLGVPTR